MEKPLLTLAQLAKQLRYLASVLDTLVGPMSNDHDPSAHRPHKIHWTQTASGKRRMAAIQKARRAAKKAPK